ncbi:hypothetical protein ACU8KH_00418 [Lachancea thermotolerans]
MSSSSLEWKMIGAMVCKVITTEACLIIRNKLLQFLLSKQVHGGEKYG